MDLIDRKALYEETKEYCERYNVTNWTNNDVLEWIVGSKIVDAEPVVRCKDCCYKRPYMGLCVCKITNTTKKPDGFCDKGHKDGE